MQVKVQVYTPFIFWNLVLEKKIISKLSMKHWQIIINKKEGKKKHKNSSGCLNNDKIIIKMW